MARDIKHVGKMKNTGNKVAVVFRTIPGESDSALVLPTATLPDIYHDSLMKLIETDSAQTSFELGEVMFRSNFPDGKPMLQAMRADGRLQKVKTADVMMTPSPTQEINLSELNGLIAEQKGVNIDELYTFVSGAPKPGDKVEEVATVTETPAPLTPQAPDNGVLSDADIAKSYRSQADAMYKEAARLRREADELDPPVKKASKAKTEAVQSA